jgi:hypothetical protein
VTDERTPEQVKADNLMDDAIAEAAKAYDLVPEGDVVTTWAVVGASIGLDAGRTNYFGVYPGGNLPPHVAVGLFEVAKNEVLSGSGDDE